MKIPSFRMLAIFAVLLLPCTVLAQNKVDREIDIHENVKLVVMAIPSDVPGDMAEQFRLFIPILEEVLKEDTTDQSTACALTIEATAGFKEVGSRKVKRPTAIISAFRRSSRQEFIGTFILHSYMNDGLVNNEETGQFLKKQILEPAACRADE
jgi:hypothetical protein